VDLFQTQKLTFRRTTEGIFIYSKDSNGEVSEDGEGGGGYIWDCL